ATPPSMYEPIAASLSAAGLNREPPPSGWRRIVVEKPFGSDLQSAKALSRSLLEAFEEAQIYRIDHYLGKETVQNLLVFRFANGIFEPLWNRNYVHHVEVTSAESIGVEGRGRYYDGAGALRDMVQNHLLQVVGMVAMEPPSSLEPDAIRNETLKVFQSLRPLSREDCERFVVRGQYAASTIDGKMVPGYRNEDGVAPDSRTETYVALRFFVDNWRWGGVPFYIRTGKRLPTRATEVVVHFKPTPHRLFGSDVEVDHGRNHLVIRIQPDEGILLEFGMKLPGAGFEVKDVAMDFRYADLSDAYVPEPYERLLLDCMLGDQTLFARSDVVEACWEFVTPILNAWKANSQLKPYEYPAGTWGPREADTLLAHQGEAWRNPRSDAPQGGRR
ncbi:MAG: glucose-6-phosphate dehydrogenase, partial [Armatimonadota bacterium]